MRLAKVDGLDQGSPSSRIMPAWQPSESQASTTFLQSFDDARIRRNRHLMLCSRRSSWRTMSSLTCANTSGRGSPNRDCGGSAALRPSATGPAASSPLDPALSRTLQAGIWRCPTAGRIAGRQGGGRPATGQLFRVWARLVCAVPTFRYSRSTPIGFGSRHPPRSGVCPSGGAAGEMR